MFPRSWPWEYIIVSLLISELDSSNCGQLHVGLCQSFWKALCYHSFARRFEANGYNDTHKNIARHAAVSADRHRSLQRTCLFFICLFWQTTHKHLKRCKVLFNTSEESYIDVERICWNVFSVDNTFKQHSSRGFEIEFHYERLFSSMRGMLLTDGYSVQTWWCDDMEMLFALLALDEGNSPVRHNSGLCFRCW